MRAVERHICLLVALFSAGCGLEQQFIKGGPRLTPAIGTVTNIKTLQVKSNGTFTILKPSGLVSDPFGRLIVADATSDRIYCIQDDSILVYQFGGYGQGKGQFIRPYGLAVDKAGNIYVTDRGNHRVQKFDGRGNYLIGFGEYGSGKGQFNNPAGIAVDGFGYIYVADAGNNRIQRFTQEGKYVSEFGEYGWGEGFMNAPDILVVDGENNLYLEDLGNKRIQKFDFNGNFLEVTDELDLGGSIAVSGSGTVYYSDAKDGSLKYLNRLDYASRQIEGLQSLNLSPGSDLCLDCFGKKLYISAKDVFKITVIYGNE